MEKLEQELKALIIDKNGTLSKFAEKIDMPWPTLDSVLKRGINKSNVSNIIKICQGLQISADELAKGNIIEIEKLRNENDSFSDEIRAIARGAQNLSPAKKELLLKLIQSMSDSADEELEK